MRGTHIPARLGGGTLDSGVSTRMANDSEFALCCNYNDSQRKCPSHYDHCLYGVVVYFDGMDLLACGVREGLQLLTTNTT
jgi:hypothetical protein